MWWVLLIEFMLCLGAAIYGYSTYGPFRKDQWYVPVLVILGWTLSFFIVFLVPNDVSAAAHCDVEYCGDGTPTNCSGSPLVSQNTLEILWTSLYWSTLCLTFFVYPIMQDYSRCGHFTFVDKMVTSIKLNLLLYTVMICVLIGAAIIYFIHNNLSWSGILDVAMAAANAYGLFLLISLLGHGVVNVPRRLWRASNRKMMLAQSHYELASLSDNLEEAYDKLNQVLKLVRKASDLTPQSDPFRPFVDVIINKCPPEYAAIMYGEGNFELSYDKLCSLHEKLMNAMHNVQMYTSMYCDMLKSALHHEDISHSKSSGLKYIKWTEKAPRSHAAASIINTLEYVWYCYLESWFLKALCGTSVVIGVLLVWSELIFFLCAVDLSIVSLYIRFLRTFVPDLILQISIFLPVVFIAYCSISSLLRLRLFNYYHLIPHGSSDSNSLLFSASYLCRLTSPLAYNFMMMSHYPNTAFIIVMGPINLTPLGKYFQLLFPMVLVPFSLATLFNLYSKILSLLHIKRFQFDEDFLQDNSQIQEGVLIANSERQSFGNGEDIFDPLRRKRSRRMSVINGNSSSSLPLSSSRDSAPSSEGSTFGKVKGKFLSFFSMSGDKGSDQNIPEPPSGRNSLDQNRITSISSETSHLHKPKRFGVDSPEPKSFFSSSSSSNSSSSSSSSFFPFMRKNDPKKPSDLISNNISSSNQKGFYNDDDDDAWGEFNAL